MGEGWERGRDGKGIVGFKHLLAVEENLPHERTQDILIMYILAKRY